MAKLLDVLLWNVLIDNHGYRLKSIEYKLKIIIDH